MTIIAWDGQTLATDSQGTNGQMVYSLNRKKLIEMKFGEPHPLIKSKRCYVACAGAYDDICCFLGWFREGVWQEKEYPRFAEDLTAVILDCEGRLWEMTGRQAVLIEHDGMKDAWGSGYEYCQGWLDSGADAIQAVEATIKKSLYSGGEVQYVTWLEATKTMLVKELPRAS